MDGLHACQQQNCCNSCRLTKTAAPTIRCPAVLSCALYVEGAPWPVRLAKGSVYSMLAYCTLVLVAGRLDGTGSCILLTTSVGLTAAAGMALPTSWCRTLAHLVLPEGIFTIVQQDGVLSGASEGGNGEQLGCDSGASM